MSQRRGSVGKPFSERPNIAASNMSGLRSRTASTSSLASTTSCSSSVSEQSFKKSPKYVQEIERQISEMRAACALVAAAELDEEYIQALRESPELVETLKDAFDALKNTSDLAGMEQSAETSPEDLAELDLRLKTLENIRDSMKALRAKALLSKIALTGDSELNSTLGLLNECSRAIADVKSQDVIVNTEAVICQVLEINELYKEISRKTKTLDYLNELEDSLHVYLESLVISAEMIDFPN